VPEVKGRAPDAAVERARIDALEVRLMPIILACGLGDLPRLLALAFAAGSAVVAVIVTTVAMAFSRRPTWGGAIGIFLRTFTGSWLLMAGAVIVEVLRSG